MNDLISRQAAISIISEYFDGLEDNDTVSEYDFRDLLNEMPSVKAIEKTGKWMGTVCSACGNSCSYEYDAKYCPNCGAKMERGEDE